jgi:hypothetical protein
VALAFACFINSGGSSTVVRIKAYEHADGQAAVRDLGRCLADLFDHQFFCSKLVLAVGERDAFALRRALESSNVGAGS